MSYNERAEILERRGRNMKLLELGFLNPNRSAFAIFSSNLNARMASYSPSFTQTNNGSEKDTFVKKNDENGMKRLSRKLGLYAAGGIAVTATWIYILIQRKKLEELKVQAEKMQEMLASRL